MCFVSTTPISCLTNLYVLALEDVVYMYTTHPARMLAAVNIIMGVAMGGDYSIKYAHARAAGDHELL